MDVGSNSAGPRNGVAQARDHDMSIPMSTNTVEQFCSDIQGIQASTDLRERQIKSRDFHWYSPVLTPQLQKCIADVVVQPRSEEELRAVIAAAIKHRIPMTLRGGGTGNYGQSVPLKGGIVVDMTGLNRVLAVESGSLRVQARA